jgi:HK97 family phage portal protein
MGKILDYLYGPEPVLKRELIEPTTEPPTGPDAPNVLPPSRNSTGEITGRDALGISMVYRAIVIHAITAKQMSIAEWQSSVTSDELTRAPFTSPFLRKPDPDMPRSAFIEMTVVSLACTGNAYWRITRKAGVVTAARVLDPNHVTPVMDAFKTRIVGYRIAGQEAVEPVKNIKHLKLLRVPGSALGLGPIQAAQAELRGAIDLSHYAGNFFNDSGIPTGILQSDLQLNKEQAALYKQAFKSSMAGKRDIAVLGMGLKYTPVFIKPADAQFLESKQYTTTEIARMFGTPSSLMLANIQGSSQTYQNVAQDWLGFIRFSNMQYLIEIEDALSDLLPMQRVAKFVTDDMTRTDTTTRYSEFETGLRAGFLHVDEVRRIEKLGPMPTTRTPAPATAPATAPDREDNE